MTHDEPPAIPHELKFTAEQKFRCAAREWEMRKRVYPRLVTQGKMTHENADLEIAMMAEIADDYRERALTDRLL